MADWFTEHAPTGIVNTVKNWFGKNAPAPQGPISGSDSLDEAGRKNREHAEPMAVTRLGRIPLYSFDDPNSALGWTPADTQREPGILINTKVSEDQVGETIRHELTHRLIAPPTIAAAAGDPLMAPYIDKIRKGLHQAGPKFYPADLPAGNAVSEGLAYITGGYAPPGLNAEDAQAFVNQARTHFSPEDRAYYQTGKLLPAPPR